MSGERIDLCISGSLGTDLHVLGRGPTTTFRLDLANGHIDATFHGDELLQLRDWITEQHDGGSGVADKTGEHCTECGHPRHDDGAACLVVVEEYPIDGRCLRTPCECLGDAPAADRTELLDAVTWAQMYVDNDAGPHRRKLGLILDELERLQRQVAADA